MPVDEKHEDYFWERYQTLARTEEDSDLRQILSGVGPIKTFSDVRTVLQMYDEKAEITDSNYWFGRYNHMLNWMVENTGLIDVSHSDYCRLGCKVIGIKDWVKHHEAELAGEIEWEDITNHPL